MGDQKNTQIKAKMTFSLSLSRVRNVTIFVAFVLHKAVGQSDSVPWELALDYSSNNKLTTNLLQSLAFELVGFFWSCSSMQK